MLARSASGRWPELEIVHPSDHIDVEARLRHGELHTTLIDDSHRTHDVGAPPSDLSARPVEPYATNYQSSAMLDPYELSEGIEISDLRIEELVGRPVAAFVARADPAHVPHHSRGAVVRRSPDVHLIVLRGAARVTRVRP